MPGQGTGGFLQILPLRRRDDANVLVFTLQIR
jgi:hypothetical protein